LNPNCFKSYHRKGTRFFQEISILRIGKDNKGAKEDLDGNFDFGNLLIRPDSEYRIPHSATGLIFVELDRFSRTPVNAGPAFNTLLGTGRIRFLFLNFVDFTWANLSAVSAASGFVLINNGIHNK
jgi:hypothetical protein